MQKFSTSPIEIILSFFLNKNLIITMTKREIIGRYRGSLLGTLWSFFNPIFMLAVYTFFFSTIFKSRWEGSSGSKTEFAIILFSGMLVFGLFSECINRAPNLILSNVNFVKKVIFPLEILAFINIGTAIFHLMTGLLAWLIFYTIFFGIPKFTILLLPFILLPLIIFTLGISWMLSSLGVFLRDVGQTTSIFVTALSFLTPIFYPISAIPPEYQSILQINPLTTVIENTRKILVWGQIPEFTPWLISLIISIFVAYLGFAWFQKTRKGFSDVL